MSGDEARAAAEKARERAKDWEREAKAQAEAVVVAHKDLDQARANFREASSEIATLRRKLELAETRGQSWENENLAMRITMAEMRGELRALRKVASLSLSGRKKWIDLFDDEDTR